MQVTIEKTRTTCDHCGKLDKAIILYAEFAHQKNDSVQFCHECAIYFAKEIMRRVEDEHETVQG